MADLVLKNLHRLPVSWQIAYLRYRVTKHHGLAEMWAKHMEYDEQAREYHVSAEKLLSAELGKLEQQAHLARMVS